ncbi:MAG: hypothetical protein Q8P29_04215, partial [Candidatus Levybacteria bacterium]|nr:hypothetical protein [Candidatus Levybacteria bacterium]
ISEDFAKSYFSGFNPRGNIFIKNDGKIISLPQEIIITTNFLKPLSQKIYLRAIPPFGFIKIPIKFNKPSFLTNKTESVKIALNESFVTKKIRITPFILNRWTILGGTIFVSIIIGISLIIHKTRNLSFFKQKKEDSLRGQSKKP